MPILYIEVFFVLINGCLMLLAFEEEGEAVSADLAMAYMAKLQADKKPQAAPMPQANKMPAVIKKVVAKKKVAPPK